MPPIEKAGVNTAWRARVSLGVAAAAFFVIILRLWYLQIVHGAFFRDRSENNRIRTMYVPPPRGEVTDRNGLVLVKSRPSFNVELVTEDSAKPEQAVREVARLSNEDPEQLVAQFKRQSSRRRFEPRVIIRDASWEQVARVAARRHLIPGVVVNVTPARNYVYGHLASHLLGYIREINEQQLQSPEYAGYRFGDLVGQFGLESRLERYLQGQRGVQLVIVNAMGTRIGESSFEPERQGHTVRLTIDLEVQRAAEAALAEHGGALVAMDVRTGEVLAMASGPDFDPNMFIGDITPAEWQDLVAGPRKRLANRVLQGSYAPGSTFKIFMAAAALAEKVTTEHERIYCPGYLSFGGRRFRCHKPSGHGLVNLHEAMVQSCDVFFYTVGQRLTIDRIHHYANLFGFGRVTGFDLGHENRGLVPSTAWKRRYFKNPAEQKWYPGETLSVAIGQGALLVTPLQLARAVAALVNGGRVLTPYAIKEVVAEDGTVVEATPGPKEESRVELSPRIVKFVEDSLVGVVNEPTGTGRRSRLPADLPFTVAGKTGTAQVASLHLQHKFKDNAWFVGYAPADKPEIVVVALVEGGGHGGAAAAPAVGGVLEAYFTSKLFGPHPAPRSPDEATHAGAGMGS